MGTSNICNISGGVWGFCSCRCCRGHGPRWLRRRRTRRLSRSAASWLPRPRRNSGASLILRWVAQHEWVTLFMIFWYFLFMIMLLTLQGGPVRHCKSWSHAPSGLELDGHGQWDTRVSIALSSELAANEWRFAGWCLATSNRFWKSLARLVWYVLFGLALPYSTSEIFSNGRSSEPTKELQGSYRKWLKGDGLGNLASLQIFWHGLSWFWNVDKSLNDINIKRDQHIL